jgi:hypothetical protein
MTRDIERSLQKLESQVPRQPTEQEKNVERLQRFVWCAIAYYLGDLKPEESVAEAYTRALGYPNVNEFRKVLGANDPDLQERMRMANSKLLEKFGVSSEPQAEEITEAFQRMEDGLPEQYKACWR